MLTSRSKLDFVTFFVFFDFFVKVHFDKPTPSSRPPHQGLAPRAPRRRDAGSVRGNQRVD
jgi:hypothetical protein